MNSKIIITGLVAAIVIVAGGSAAYMIANQSKSPIPEVEATVEIYGNANNDAYMDGDDIDLLKEIADSGYWDSSKYPFADADLDGFITNKDVEIVQKIINEESCTVYYKNYFGEAQPLSYPMKGQPIGLTYWQQAEMMAALGLWNLVKAGPHNYQNWYNHLYPLDGVTIYQAKNSHNSGVTDSASEIFKSTGVKVIVATPTEANKTALQKFIDDGVNVIYLWYTGDWSIPTMMTLGILLGAKEKAKEYYDFANDVINTINDRLDGHTRKTALVCSNSVKMGSDAITTTFSIHSNPHEGNYYFTNLVATAYTNSSDLTEFGASSRSMEWLLLHDQEFDYLGMWVNQSGFANGADNSGVMITQAQYNERFDAGVDGYQQTSAYKNGNIFAMPYDMLGGISGYGLVMTIAFVMYPDLFTLEEAQDKLQEWFDRFTVSGQVGDGINVRTMGAYIYTGDYYKTSYSSYLS